MTVTAKNRVMIFGPKADGTYVLSSRRQRGRHWRSQSPGQRQRCSNISRSVCRMDCSCRTFRREQLIVRRRVWPYIFVSCRNVRTDTLLWGVSMQRCVHAGCRRSNVNTFTGGLHKRRPWRTDRARVNAWHLFGSQQRKKAPIGDRGPGS